MNWNENSWQQGLGRKNQCSHRHNKIQELQRFQMNSQLVPPKHCPLHVGQVCPVTLSNSLGIPRRKTVRPELTAVSKLTIAPPVTLRAQKKSKKTLGRSSMICSQASLARSWKWKSSMQSLRTRTPSSVIWNWTLQGRRKRLKMRNRIKVSIRRNSKS